MADGVSIYASSPTDAESTIPKPYGLEAATQTLQLRENADALKA